MADWLSSWWDWLLADPGADYPDLGTWKQVVVKGAWIAGKSVLTLWLC
jgi:hypothetical protein